MKKFSLPNKHKINLFFSSFLGGMLLSTIAFADAASVADRVGTEAARPNPVVITETHNTRLWNLQDADILSVINEVSQETGKNFVVDPRVNGKITLISSKPLDKKETYDVFLSIIGMLGYSAIPTGDVVKIVPNMESSDQAPRMATLYRPGKGDEIVVRVIPMQNISASQMIPVLRPMLPQWSSISAYTPSNVLIVLGRASGVQRIYDIIQQVDRSTNNTIQMITLKRATASQVASVLSTLQNAARANGESSSVAFAVDERTNSVLLSGPKAGRIKMSLLIAQLDNQSQATSGNTDVVYLRYLKAKDLAPILGKIAQNIMSKDAGGSPGNSSSGASSGTKESPNNTSIQAEPNTNAIIITAPPAMMRSIKIIISKLDVRPAQVLVEAIIAEVDESNITSLGIQWGGGVAHPKLAALGNLPQFSSGSDVTAFPPIGAGVFGIISNINIQAVLSALRNQNGVEILSTPSLMILDNQEGFIEIGQDVPYQNGSYTTPGTSSVQPFSTIAYKPVTLRLQVTPQINLGNSVRLKIVLKKDTLQNPSNPTTSPIINKSTIDNAVIINSDDMLVLGGLISDSNNENLNKVPILGDLPIVGPLFQQRKSNQQKRNLMVFLKPIIINRGGDDGLVITQQKYAAMRSAQGNFKEDLRDIGDEAVPVQLPPWDHKRDLPVPFECK